MKKVFTILTFLFSTQFVFAQALGTLDANFGINGHVIPRFSNLSNYASAGLVQPDGKILFLSYVFSYSFTSSDSGVLIRYLPNGKIDNSFGVNGLAATISSYAPYETTAMATQSDGKIVVGGRSHIAEYSLIRYNSNGSLDTSFSKEAFVRFDNVAAPYMRKIIIQPDGKIVAIGVIYCYVGGTNAHHSKIAIARFNQNGTLDTSFNTTGTLIEDIYPQSQVGALFGASTIQADNKLIVAIGAYNADAVEISLNRYTTSGTLDATFGTNGSFSIKGFSANSLKVLSDGKVLLGGFSSTNKKDTIVLYRCNPNGTLDATFGTNGKVTTPIGNTASIYNLFVQADDKILIHGIYKNLNSNTDSAGNVLARYSANGVLDNTFGSNGKIQTSYNLPGQLEYFANLQSDGKVVAFGYYTDSLSTNPDHWTSLITRYNTTYFSNDSCQNVTILTPSVSVNGTTANATAEASPNRVLPCETNQNVKDVWYKFRSDTGALRSFRMQLTLTQLANSTAFKYAVYSGSCSDFVLRGACKTVALNATVVDTIVLLEANQDYFIRVWSSDTAQAAAFSIKIQSVQNFNAVPIAQATTVTACQPFASVDISSANSQKWISLMDATNIVAEINPNGNLLGQVTGGYFINSTGTIRRASGTPYLDRNIGIKVTNPPTTSVGVRLYFTERERAAYFAIVGANPVAITHYAGALCSATVQTGSGDLFSAIIQSTPSGNYYVEFNTTRFSGFFLGPNRSLVFSHEVNAEPTKLMIQEVYPMPISTELGVVFTANQATSKGRIFVTDILGKTILANTISIESGRNELKLNTSALANGLYILHISDGVYETAKKMIKQ